MQPFCLPELCGRNCGLMLRSATLPRREAITARPSLDPPFRTIKQRLVRTIDHHVALSTKTLFAYGHLKSELLELCLAA